MNGVSVSLKFGISNKENPNLENEYNVLYDWKQILEERYKIKFVIVNNSTDYTTLQPENCLDLLRLKYGGAKWIKVFITNELNKTLVDDPRFAAEKKKKQSYWKSTLENTDISKYFDVLDEAIKWLLKNQIKNE